MIVFLVGFSSGTSYVLNVGSHCTEINTKGLYMKNYVEQKKPVFEKELQILFSVLDHMKKNGLIEKTKTNVDFTFTSDKKENLENYLNELKKEFMIKVYGLKKINLLKNEYELSIEIEDVIMEKELLVYLIYYLFSTSIENNCILGDWGALIQNIEVDLKSIRVNEEIKKGYDYYQNSWKFKSYVSFYLASEAGNSPEAFINLGNAYIQLKDQQNAIMHYDKAIALGSMDAKAAKEKGLSLLDPS